MTQIYPVITLYLSAPHVLLSACRTCAQPSVCTFMFSAMVMVTVFWGRVSLLAVRPGLCTWEIQLNSDSDLIWSPSNTNTNPAPFSFSLIKLERAEMSEHLELFQKLHHTDLVMLVKTAIIALRSHIRTFASLNCVMKAVHLISPPRNKQTHPRIFI